MSASKLEIIIYRADGTVAGDVMCNDPRITLGRSQGCEVVIDDPSVAATHAVVTFTGRSCVIEPIGDAVVLANGQRTDSHLVQRNDRITIGAHHLRFEVHQSPGVTDTSKTRVVKQAEAPKPLPPLADLPEPPTKIIHVPQMIAPIEAAPAPSYSEETPTGSFSLLQALQDAAKPLQRGPFVLEAVAARFGRVHRITHIAPGVLVRMPPPTSLQCTFSDDGAFEIRAPIKLRGRANRNGQLVSFFSLLKSTPEGDTLHAEPGTSVELQLNDRDTLLFQRVARVELPPPPRRFAWRPSAAQLMALAVAVTAHLVAMSAIGERPIPEQHVDAVLAAAPHALPPPVTPPRAFLAAGPGALRMSGPLAKNDVLKVVNAHAAELERCYDGEGRIVSEWIITAPGAVSQVKSKSPCLEQIIARWAFPRARSASNVSYVFVFTEHK